MRQKCVFNPKTDLQETIPGLDTDLALAMEKGVVMDTGINPEYNLIDDPRNIRGRVGDAFDAINAQKAILDAGKLPGTTDSAKQPAAAGAAPSETAPTASAGQTA